MLASATHDHKRGEDVRARLAVLSEIPGRWRETVTGWVAAAAAIDDAVDAGACDVARVCWTHREAAAGGVSCPSESLTAAIENCTRRGAVTAAQQDVLRGATG